MQRALVVGRLLGVATTVLALGSGAHVLGGGHAPSGAALALIGALVLMGSAALARRPLTVRVLLPAAVAGQLTVHVALTWLAPAGAAAMAGGAHAGDARLVGHAGHPAALAGGPATAASSVLDGADPVAGAAVADPHGPGGPMLLAHAVAMAATVLLLVATDRGLVALAGRWAALLPALTGGLPGTVPARPRPVAPGRPAPRPLPALRGGAARRGPPAALRPRVA